MAKAIKKTNQKKFDESRSQQTLNKKSKFVVPTQKYKQIKPKSIKKEPKKV